MRIGSADPAALSAVLGFVLSTIFVGCAFPDALKTVSLPVGYQSVKAALGGVVLRQSYEDVRRNSGGVKRRPLTPTVARIGSKIISIFQ
jgi:hypothetical protein